jgi:N-acetylmuramoyl-L-alanine amidase
MRSHGTRNKALKKSILREIYVDNLKFSGKRMEEIPSPPKNKATVHLLRVIMVVCAVALCSFTYQAPLQHDPDETQAKKLALTDTEMDKPLLNAVIDTDLTDLGVRPSVLESSLLPHQSLFWNWHEPVDQRLDDFNLLLSSNGSVRLSSLFGLGVKTIVIDPGHGGRDPGAIGENGTQEKDITLDVAIKLKERLVTLNGFHVLLTRETDRTLSLAERVDYAKANSTDIFVSIHVNSLPQKSVNLIETYYFGPPLNFHSLRLAEEENKSSNFSVGELDTIIKDIGNTLKRQESASLAASIQERLFLNLKNQDAQVVDSGIKMAPFVVLSQIEVPSVLVEISCISKTEEESKLALTGYREKVASYIEEGIVSYLETQLFQISKGENQDEQKPRTYQ